MGWAGTGSDFHQALASLRTAGLATTDDVAVVDPAPRTDTEIIP